MCAFKSEFILLAALLSCVVDTSAAPPGSAWALAWSDEFNGSSVDSSKWNIYTGNRRDAVNTASALSVQSGYLTLKTYTSGGTHYTGWIGTDGKFDQAFGYWEARIRFHDSAGMWSAFWLQSPTINNTGNNPAANGAEIDIVEHRSQDSGGANLANSASYNIHWDGYGASHKSVGTTVGNPGSTNLTDNWHTYGLLWTPDAYYFYIDGVQTWSTSSGVSQRDEWIYLSSEVESGAWAGNVPGGGYGSSSSSVTKMDVDYVRFYKPAEVVVNGGFEARYGTWSSFNQASWSSGNGRGGSDGARVNPSTTAGSSAEQTVYGLAGNTPYVLTGWGRTSADWPTIRVGVKGFGGSETYGFTSSSTFTRIDVPFTTGGAGTSARVYGFCPTQWGDCFVDDFKVRRAASVMDTGFDTGDLANFWSSYGDVLVHSWSPVRSGSHAFRFNNPAANRGIEQEIVGLDPSTTYAVSCWFRTDNQQLRLGVKNHGAAESSTTKTIYGNTWQRHEHVFTTGASARSATIYAWIPSAYANSVVDVDDFFLAEPLPSEWTPADIGSVGIAGEAGIRNGAVIVKAAGADIWSTQDSFRFVHQTLTGDGFVQARVRWCEPTHSAAKAGVMIRSSTGTGSRNVFIGWRPDGRVETTRRNTSNSSSSSDIADAPEPVWVRIDRAGSVFTPSYSVDGVTWAQLGPPQTVSGLATGILAGLAVVSHDTALLNESAFDHVSVVAFDGDQDGLLDAWETQYFGGSGANPEDDPDSDGFTNGQEQLTGTHPRDSRSSFKAAAAFIPDGSGCRITWPSVPGRTYTVQFKSDLAQAWGTLATVPAAAAPATTTSITDSAVGQARRFYQVIAQ